MKSWFKSILSDAQLVKLVKNSSWVFVANGLRATMQIGKSILIARGLGVEMFGVFVVLINLISVVQESLNLNLSTSIVKFGAGYEDENKKFYKAIPLFSWSILTTIGMNSLALIVLFGALYFRYDLLVGTPGLVKAIMLLAFSLSFKYVLGAFLFASRLVGEFKYSSMAVFVGAVIELLGVVLLYYYEVQIESFLMFFALISFISLIIQIGLINRKIANFGLSFITSSALSFGREKVKEVMRFSVSNSLGRTLQTLIKSGSIVFLNTLSTSSQVGLYSAGIKVSNSILLITDPLGGAIFPQLSSLAAKNDYEAIKQLLTKLTKIGLMLSFIPLAIAYFFRQEIVVFIFGREYIDASDIFFVGLIGTVISSVFFWHLFLMLSLGLVKFRLIGVSIRVILFFSVGYFLLPKYGGLGLAMLVVGNIFLEIASHLVVCYRFISLKIER